MKNVKVFAVIVCVMVVANFVSAASVYFDDGQNHSINNNTHQNDTIWLDKNTVNNPGTHFELLTGGKIKVILPFNKSTITINGGVLDGFNAAIDTHGDNIVTINGGTIIGDVAANNNSRIFMNGGSLVNAIGSNTDIYAYNNGICEIRGGSIGGILGTFDSGKIYLYGSNFSVNGQTVHYGDSLRDYVSLSPTYPEYFTGRITGTLQNGSAMSNDFWIWASTDDDIIVVPEPASAFLVIAGMGLFRLRREKK